MKLGAISKEIERELHLDRGRESGGSIRTRIVPGEHDIFRLSFAGLILIGTLHLGHGLVLIYRSSSSWKNLLARFLKLGLLDKATLVDGNLGSLDGSVIAEDLYEGKVRKRRSVSKVEGNVVGLKGGRQFRKGKNKFTFAIGKNAFGPAAGRWPISIGNK